MSINGSAPRRGNVGTLGGKASLMAVSRPLTNEEPVKATDKEIRQHLRKLGVRDKHKLQQCLMRAESLRTEHPLWDAERIARKAIELLEVSPG